MGLFIAVPMGQLYLRYTTPLYQAKAKLMIKGIGKSSSLSETDLVDLLGIGSGGKDIDNEIEILKSRPIIAKTIERLGINISYYRIGRVKNAELYKSAPLKLQSYELAKGIERCSFFINMGYYDDFEFMLAADSEKSEKYQLGVPFSNQFGKFLISRDSTGKFVPGIYQINIVPAVDLANSFKSRLAMEVVGTKRSSSILELKLIDPSPQKASDFINTLIDVYNQEEINDNTIILKNTISFIDERIKSLTIELDDIEGDIERFKGKNEIISQDANSSLGFALGEMRSSLAELSSYQIEKELLISLEEYLKKEENKHDLIPINMAASNASISNLVTEYNSLFLQQKRMKETVTNENPAIISNETRLSELRTLMVSSVEGLLRDIEIPVSRVKKDIAALKSNMQNIPSIEKSLLEKLRLQSIKENLFLFLLQKREETALSKAVTAVNTRTIEHARSSRGPVFPNKKLILTASVVLGLVIPLLLVSVLLLLETTVDSEDVLKSLTSIPILGIVSHNKSEEKVFVQDGVRSVISELYRLLRTNLNFLNLNKDRHVVMVTSSVSGEGKSVTIINLGLTIGLSKKKVVVVDFDLRKPKISEYLVSGKAKGVTDYLSSNCSLDDIVNQYNDNEYFHFINSGPIPPNPSELILSDKMASLIEELKKTYDYVLIDTPPIGVVADALLLRKFITNTLLVVRYKYTKKAMVKHLEEMYAKEELVKPSIIFNDLKINAHGYGGYKGNYGAGYYQ